MPRVEAELDAVAKEAFQALARRSGMSEAALLRRVISTLVKTNFHGPVDKSPEDKRSMQIAVRMTPDVFQAVTQAASSSGTTRPRIVLGTLRARFLHAPTLLPMEAEAVANAAYQLARVGINLNQLVRSLHQQQGTQPAIEPVVSATTAAVDELREQMRRMLETATLRWGPKGSWE